MKGLVLFLSALCLSEDFCKGQNSYQDVEDQIVHYVSVHGNKGYHFQYKTKNGIEREETGKVDANDNLEVQGNYAYFSPEGLKIENSYHAGKDGFRPSLRFIPTNQAEFKKTIPKVAHPSREDTTNDNHLLNIIKKIKNNEFESSTENSSFTTEISSPSTLPNVNNNTTTSITNVNVTLPPVESPELFIPPVTQVGSAVIATLAGGGLGR
ncbi:unnamed protein product [Brassicogethes aeneus]|uniref:Uncharacterized protein n=1 Tax=Brassicogethes aeneus TaxID=1431903 RepID=A0A9P0B9K1_BRAAE|nr:unnamed protein product [Brassicogethes aeneus]